MELSCDSSQTHNGVLVDDALVGVSCIILSQWCCLFTILSSHNWALLEEISSCWHHDDFTLKLQLLINGSTKYFLKGPIRPSVIP
jgi:hypothetical protein